MTTSPPTPDSNSTPALRESVIAAIRSIFDPEIPVNIYELGLIYNICITKDASVRVDMTLTSPNCPVAESLPRHVQTKIKELPGVRDAEVRIVWEPPWSPEKMSDLARLELELRGIPDLSHVHKKDRFTGMTINRKHRSDG